MIPLIKPAVDFNRVIEDVRLILESGQLTSGRYVASFEKSLAEYLGVKHAVATTSATTALHLAIEALGIGDGDEVLVSDFSFPASGNAIVQTGAIPVFVDCMPGRFDLDPDDLIRRISARSRALMVVHPFGQPANMSIINSIAKQNGIRVIEDAACALGSRHHGQLCGTLSDVGCFSFHPRKLLTTGEGGLIVTSDDSIFEKIAILRNHGGKRDDVGLTFIENGFNYRMSEIQAAVGLSQLHTFDANLRKRRELANSYTRRFSNNRHIKVPISDRSENCTFQSYVILLDKAIDRNRLVAELRIKNIETTLGTYAMHSQPAFSRFGYAAGDLPWSFNAQRQSLTLPLFESMSDDMVEYIVGSIENLL